MKSPTRFAAAAGAVVAAVAFGSTAALAGGSSSGHDGDELILRSSILGSQLVDPPIAGATRGGAPWVLDEGEARLSQDGSLRVEVEGLVIPGRGNPVPLLSASVVCGGVVVATTPTAPFGTTGDKVGDSRIRAKVMLPDRCLAPAILLNPNGNAAVYIGVSGG
jgi:hypothetical protein